MMKTMTKTYHFNKENIRIHDVFYGEHYDLNGIKYGHYFYCIYAQEEDENYQNLFRDVIGLLITTKEVPGYSVKIQINGKDAFVCCDNEYRFISEVGKIQNKFLRPSLEERTKILECYKDFNKEKVRQMKVELKRK